MARPRIFRFLKHLLARSGLTPSRLLAYLNGLFEFGRWLRSHEIPVVLEGKQELYAYLQQEVLGAGAIDYLEFGVWQGTSLSSWLALNLHPASRFFGFDSFEGLPEDWGHFAVLHKQGTFDMGGSPPAIDDGRVEWVKGYFQETLAPFLEGYEPKHRLVVHCDADLYSSTLYVLTVLNPYLVPGTIVIFDEFFTVDHEFKALTDFIRAYHRDYRVVASSGPYDQMAIEITA